MSRNVGQIYDPFDQIYGGSALKATYRHRIRLFSASGGLSVQFVFTNFKNCPDSISGLSTIFVAAAVEISGVVTPLTFSGAAEVSIAPGARAVSDAITLTSSDYIVLRTRPRVASSGQKWPTGFIHGGASFGNEGMTDDADLTTTGSGAVTVAIGYGYGPYQIIANTNTLASIFVEGDSIAGGTGDDGTTGYTAEHYLSDKGWIARVVNHTRPIKFNAKAGTTASQHATNTYTNAEYGYHTYLLCELGVNDLSGSVASIKASLKSIWDTARTAGLRIAQTTLVPDGNSGHETTRTTINDWIRGRGDANEIDYVVEVADAVETARNSGVWRTGYSGDNLHPNTTGHTAIAAAVGTALMADIALADNLPTITGVTITNGASANVAGGATLDLDATVEGTNSPSQVVTWSKRSGVGSVNSSMGVYTAPAATASAQSAVIRATASDGVTYDEITLTIPAWSVPTISGASINSLGTQLTLTTSLATTETTPGQGFTVKVNGTSRAAIWSRGSTTSLTASLLAPTILDTDVVTFDYASGTGNVTTTAQGAPLATISGGSVTNNSEQSAGGSGQSFSTLNGGPIS